MELIRGLHNLRDRHRGCVLTIGNFDGVHLGHQSVLGRLAEKAAELDLPAVVMIFEPQPQEFFAPGDAPARLNRLREKLMSFTRFAVDRVVCIHFDQRFSEMTAEQFIDLLVHKLGVRYLVVGDDFRFGHQRRGDFSMLQSAGRDHGFDVVNMHTCNIDQSRISSTRLRDSLQQGDLQKAKKLLGRPYRICGRIAHGDKRGRQLGFPTANVHLHRISVPLQGVFAVEVFGLEGEPLAGVANIGTRPTVGGGCQPILEIHLLDFSREIYGRYVQVDILCKIRQEQRFESLDALKAQIDCDVTTAKTFFSNHHQPVELGA